MVMIHQFGAWPDCIAMKRMRRLGEYIQRPTRQGVAITLSAGERESIAACRDDLKWRVFVTDDHQAQRVAEAYGVQTLDTRGLLWTLCVGRRISYSEFCDGVRRVRGK